jgi:hypothetical protein
VLKALVLLSVLAYVARRLWPRSPLPWSVPLALVAVLLTVRTVGWVSGDA